MGWQPNYQSEGRIYAKYLQEHKPDAKIAILFQNDDYGKDYVKGLKDGLGDKAESMIVAELSYETTDPTIDSQIVNLKASGDRKSVVSGKSVSVRVDIGGRRSIKKKKTNTKKKTS